MSDKVENLRFNCPKCGHTRVGECKSHVSIMTEILDIREDGRHRFGTVVTEGDGRGIHYCCNACTFILYDTHGTYVRTTEGLVSWIKRNPGKKTTFDNPLRCTKDS